VQDLYKIIRILKISPIVLASKFSEIPLKKVNKIIDAKKVAKYPTYTQTFRDDNNYDQILKIDKTIDDKSILEACILKANEILEHKFDLLGSGLVEISHNSDYQGFLGNKYEAKLEYKDKPDFIEKHINSTNREYSKKLVSKLPNDYRLIDWQRDFKSGYRWRENLWRRKLSYGSKQGVDIKCPWELGRMQHLATLAYLYYFSKHYNITSNINSNLYLKEFTNQVIDFYACNPPEYGVQWTSAMDVGIRIVNILSAYDLFIDAGAEFDKEFNIMLKNMTYDHCSFVINNLEWSGGMRGNHYFANIASLICASSRYIHENLFFDFFRFAFEELFNEIMHQFNADGSNFEASIPYHFFCVEMLIHSLLCIDLAPKQAAIRAFSSGNSKYLKLANKTLTLKPALHKRLNSIAEFTDRLLSANANSYNIGDNDSGRFIKLFPSSDLLDAEQDKHRSLFIYINELRNYINNIFPNIQGYYHQSLNTRAYIDNSLIIKGIKKLDNFGLYLYSNEFYELALRCGAIGQNGKGGHSHNDQLSICLKAFGEDIFCDNGTFVYTADRKMRNAYRSVAMHNTLYMENVEQNEWAENNADDLFWIKNDRAKPKLINFDDSSIKASHKAYKEAHERLIRFYDDSLEGVDSCAINAIKHINFYISPSIESVETLSDKIIITSKNSITEFTSKESIKLLDYFHSPEYGILAAGKQIKISSNSNNIEWKIKIKRR
jgi:hypothetical protein